MLTVKNGTLYIRGMIGINRIECREIKWEVRKYAQYDSAIYIEYIPLGKRKPRATYLTYAPFAVILEGFGHIKPQVFNTVYSDKQVTVQQAKYRSCDVRWDNDFDYSLEQHCALTDAKIIADFRWHNTLAQR